MSTRQRTTHPLGKTGLLRSSLPRGSSTGDDHRRGLLTITCSLLIFATADAQAKYLSQNLSVLQIAWAESFGLFLFVTVGFWPRKGWKVLSTNRLPLQIFRAVLAILSTLLYVTALRYLPLADAVAITFISPITITALSGPLLRETVGPRRWGAVAIGLLGTIIIVRPGMGMMHWAAFFALSAALAFALFSITTRMLSSTEDSATFLFYPGFVGTLALGLIVLFQWEWPHTVLEVVLLMGTGLSSGIGHYLLVKAYRLAPASVLAPAGYLHLLWSAFFGLLIFGDLPDQWTLLGAGILIGSGLYIFHRERSDFPPVPTPRP